MATMNPADDNGLCRLARRDINEALWLGMDDEERFEEQEEAARAEIRADFLRASKPHASNAPLILVAFAFGFLLGVFFMLIFG